MDPSKFLLPAAIAMVWTFSTIQADAEQTWGALAACCYPGNGSACGGGVSTGFLLRRHTRRGKIERLIQCHVGHQSESKLEM